MIQIEKDDVSPCSPCGCLVHRVTVLSGIRCPPSKLTFLDPVWSTAHSQSMGGDTLWGYLYNFYVLGMWLDPLGPLYHYYPDCCCIVPVVCTPFFCMMYDLKTKWVAVCLESAGVRKAVCDGDSRLSHVLDSKIALTLKVDLICGNIICLIIFCLYPCTVSIFLALSRCFAACFVCDGVFGIMGNIYSEVWCALCRV
jgi:hypothetical protein